MRPAITIGGRTIRAGAPPFIMAECGVTCNYDLKITLDLIDVVADSGADSIKLIFWFPDEITSDRTVTYTYTTATGETKSENMFRMLDRLRFSFDQWVEVKAHADRRGIVLFATVNSPSGIDWAERLQLEAYKLSSWDYNYLPLWRRIARIGKPMLIDTGPVYLLDVARVIALMQEAGNDQSVLVHTVHTDLPREVNMRTIPYLASTFNSLVGFSSRDQRSETDIVAVALGASVLEKRLTLDRHLPGHHHALSLEPDGFRQWVTMIREAHESLGVPDLIPSPNDLVERKKWFRHLVAAADLDEGTTLTEAMLESKRGEAGVSPEFQTFFIGRRLKRRLSRDESIGWHHV